MDRMISHCSYSCHLCPTSSNDSSAKQRMLNDLVEYLGVINAENEDIRCVDFLGDGHQLIKDYTIRNCVLEKYLEHYVDYDDFPRENSRRKWLSRERILLFIFPNTRRTSKEDYYSWVIQHDSLRNLPTLLIERGRIPAWWRDALRHD